MKKLQFSKCGGLIPAIIQDARVNQVLMLGFMNKAAYEKTRKTKRVTFYSRSKKRLWTKGETSGNFLELVSINVDCDNDALLVRALPIGPTCHTGAESCFEKTDEASLSFLADLRNLVRERKKKLPQGSYTTSLFQKGLPKISAKVLEEAAEVVKAAASEGKKRTVEEICDLVYHLTVLMVALGVAWEDIIKCLEKRRKP